jgi:hypothetical protein
MTPDQLAAIEARAQAATEGPWESLRAGMLGTRVVRVDGEWDGLVPDEFITMVTPALRKFDDADFIAHARTDVPALLALVREQRAAIERVRALHKPFTHHFLSPPAGSLEVCHSCHESYPCPTIAALTAPEES